MIHTEPWFRTSAPTRTQEIQEAIRAQDWDRLKNLLPRLGIDVKEIAKANVEEHDVPRYFSRPGTPNMWSTTEGGPRYVVRNAQIDVQWNLKGMATTVTEERWPPKGSQSSYLWIRGETVLDLEVIVGEELVESGRARLDDEPEIQDVREGELNSRDAPTLPQEWTRLFEESIKATWGKQSPHGPDNRPSSIQGIELIGSPTHGSEEGWNISEGENAFEINYDEWYPTHWAAKVKVKWSERVTWDELGLST